MSTSNQIDNYISTELNDLDLYSNYGNDVGDVYNYNNLRSSNGSSGETKCIKNTTLRKRDSLDILKYYKKRNEKDNEKWDTGEFSSSSDQRDSLVITKDNDRVYDFYNNRRSAIQYKRYGQFLSLCDDINPEKKYIIDMFDLYNKLSAPKKQRKESFFKRVFKF